MKTDSLGKDEDSQLIIDGPALKFAIGVAAVVDVASDITCGKGTTRVGKRQKRMRKNRTRPANKRECYRIWRRR
jgi:hypothetical protein